MGIILTVIFLLILIFGVKLFNIDYNNPQAYLPQIIQKIAVLAVLIYLIRFSFKQFSINKHLYTINKHRENVLNSFKFLLNQ
jgi:hypothetical protein